MRKLVADDARVPGALLVVTVLMLPGLVHGIDFSPFSEPASPPGQVQALLKVSTLGAGGELRHEFSPSSKLRFEYYEHEELFRQQRQRLMMNYLLDMQTVALLWDWHPFEGNFRTTLGLTFSRHAVSGEAFYDERVHFPGATLSRSSLSVELERLLQGAQVDVPDEFVVPALTIDTKALAYATAEVRFRKWAPYLGIGWSSNRKNNSRLQFSVDLGVIFHGRPQVELGLQGKVAEFVNQHDPAALHAFLKQEERALEDDLAGFDFFRYFLPQSNITLTSKRCS